MDIRILQRFIKEFRHRDIDKKFSTLISYKKLLKELKKDGVI